MFYSLVEVQILVFEGTILLRDNLISLCGEHRKTSIKISLPFALIFHNFGICENNLLYLFLKFEDLVFKSILISLISLIVLKGFGQIGFEGLNFEHIIEILLVFERSMLDFVDDG